MNKRKEREGKKEVMMVRRERDGGRLKGWIKGIRGAREKRI